jgi:hypothetical protein
VGTKKPGRDKRTRAQAVAIPNSAELAKHADEIRTIGRQTFEGAVEIGRLLVRCRELLKERRTWLAWLKAEFSWSRSHADNLIALHMRRGELRKFRNLSLPVSALYLLAKAPPKALLVTEQRIAAGERLTVGAVRLLTESSRSPAARIYWQPPSPQDAPGRTLTAADFQAAEARQIAQRLGDWAYDVRDSNPAKAGEAMPAELSAEAIANARAVATYLSALLHSMTEEKSTQTNLRLIHDEDAQ